MVSSQQIYFQDRIKEIDGKKYIELDFYEYILSQRDSLIFEQQLEIQKLKQKNNKLNQRRK